MPPPTLPARALFLSFLTVFTLLLCLVPKPENDLFFILRIGTDILQTHHLPHADTYSWTNQGAPWVLPEWLAFVLYALCFRALGFFGTWLLMAAVALATASAIWRRLAWEMSLAWAFTFTCLCLLALSDFVQERPYVFTYLLLTVSLIIVMRSRATDSGGRGPWPLVPICAIWTNLHQGVVSLIGLLAAFALGDAVMALRARGSAGALFPARRASHMALAAAACTLAATATPYTWHIYQNIFVTLRDPSLMANVTEWRPITVLPLSQMTPFLLLLALSLAAFTLSRHRSLTDCLVLAVLVGQAVLHARGVPLFAIGVVVVGAPHFADLLARLPVRATPPSPLRGPLIAGFALIYAAVFFLVTVVNLKRDAGPRGLSLAGIGEAVARVPDYPWAACAFMERERFPMPLHLLNNFEIGGFLMWRLPQQPVFIDGRLDVFAGRTFDDNLVLARAANSPQWQALVQKYALDCVLTTSARQARAFAADPQWQLVYTDPERGRRPRCRILLRRRPQYAALIARCLRATAPQPGGEDDLPFLGRLP